PCFPDQFRRDACQRGEVSCVLAPTGPGPPAHGPVLSGCEDVRLSDADERGVLLTQCRELGGGASGEADAPWFLSLQDAADRSGERLRERLGQAEPADGPPGGPGFDLDPLMIPVDGRDS